MKSFFTICCIFIFTTLFSRHKSIFITNAISSGLIKFKIKGTGIYKGSCLKMFLQNNSGDSLRIIMESGRRLDSKNNDEQDILIVKEQYFVLAGYQKKEFTINGFCCQASNHAPAKNSEFKIGMIAASNLVSLSAFCNLNKFDVNETQSAVWCISDKRPLASIPESDEKLRKFVSKIMSQEIPWYQIEYEKSSSNTFISDKVERIFGNISYTLLRDDFYNIELRDSKGNLMQNFTKDKQGKKGKYDYWFDLLVSNFPKGKYFIHIYNGNDLVSRKEFII